MHSVIPKKEQLRGCFIFIMCGFNDLTLSYPYGESKTPFFLFLVNC